MLWQYTNAYQKDSFKNTGLKTKVLFAQKWNLILEFLIPVSIIEKHNFIW